MILGFHAPLMNQNHKTSGRYMDWIPVLTAAKICDENAGFFSTPRRHVLPFFSPQSASEQGFQFPAVHKRGVVIIGRPERV